MDTFTCCHCHNPHQKSPRHKNQKYCSSRQCQQARKNAWERTKVCTDPGYFERRKAQKKSWYNQRPGDRYQADYRNTHRDYQNSNKEKQRPRNQKRLENASVPKIVKTDASAGKSRLEGSWYALIPYSSINGQKIVKTDALIVQIVDAELYKGVNSHKERWKR
jgi:hypothetical protein